MEEKKIPKLSFPEITRIILENFSLFTSMPKIEAVIKTGVFCLAGANGLGKSTFLSAVNYALTGLVSDPNRSFDSVEEFYRFNKAYAASYFDGRISEDDRDSAQITLEFRIDSYFYSITRGIFETDSLRSMIIDEDVDGQRVTFIETAGLSSEELHELYTEQLTTHIGLANFQQFVFLQHFVFTFDESRRLLFWDQKVLEQALYLCFGLDYTEAHRADTLRREAEKAGSLARNSNWQATETRKKMLSLQQELENSNGFDDKLQDLAKKHKVLQAKSDLLDKELQLRKLALQDNMLQLNSLTAEQLGLRTAYSSAFAKHLKSKFHVSQHPVIVEATTETHCSICGAHGKLIPQMIALRLGEAKCPLCNTNLQSLPTDKSSIAELKNIDNDLSKITKKINSIQQTNQRITTEIEECSSKLNGIQICISDFERENEKSLNSLKASSLSMGGVESILSSYKNQLEEYTKKKAVYYQKRDEKLAELGRIQRNLERKYSKAEEHFVPLFKSLANLFLGLHLDVRLSPQGNSGLNLVVEVNGTSRRQHFQLSESQRFFIDIALRMAFAQFISSDRSKAALFIDTPEGSLDIAYESRAGTMLAQFVEAGHSLLMTANINSSKLLLSLARECTSKKMSLLRMTDWTELSEVQISEEKLFHEAYQAIEKEMKGKSRNG